MERRLFDDLVVSRRAAPRARGGMPVSFAIHAGALAGLLALGSLVPQQLPEVPVVLPPLGPLVAKAAPPAEVPRLRPGARRPAGSRPATVALPSRAVTVPDPDTDRDPALEDFDPGADPCFDCPLTDVPVGDRTVPDVEPIGRGGGGPERVRVGGMVEAPLKLRHVAPVYPALAQRAGVAGVVILECVIDKAGRIAGARVLRGHPLLDEAALDAVRQWTYRPTLLNGTPVEVVMTVTVRFATVRSEQR